MTRTVILLLLSGLAQGDASVPGGDDLSKCTMNDAPYRKLTHESKGDLWLRERAAGWDLWANTVFNQPPRSMWMGKLNPIVTIARRDTQLVVDERGALRGVLALRESDRNSKQLELYSPTGKLLWTTAPQPLWGDSAAVLVAGDLLVLGVFHRIATGSALLAVDLETGKPRWRAEVLQLHVGHSKYFNDVSLERRGDTVVMRGFEAAGCYRQTFALADGRRLSAEMPKDLWR